MVLIFVLLGMLVLAFGVVAWIFYTAKKEAASPDQDRVVPVRNLKDFKAADSAAKDAPLPSDLSVTEASSVGDNSFSVQAKVETTVPIVKVEGIKPVESRSSLREDDVRQLQDEVRLIREKAVIQAKNAIEVINRLREQVDQINVEKEGLSAAISRAASQNDLVVRLQTENDSLKGALEKGVQEAVSARRDAEDLLGDSKRQLLSAQEVVEKLKEENAALRASSVDFEQVRSAAFSSARQEFQSRMEALSAQLSVLREENSSLLDRLQILDSEDAGKGASAEEMSSVGKAMDILRDEKVSLERRIRELDSSVADQTEKNSFLQYELTKSRAQAMGLERIYENSRKQIEDLARQVNDSRLDNKELRTQAGVLEQSLNDFRRLNNELMKREKLSQFEVEKSRGDLLDLERIYDGFRLRLERAGLDEARAMES